MVSVSIIVPVYNTETYIENCLESIISQDISDKEIICVDDGSSDRSADIVKRFQKKYGFIKLIQQKNQGAAAARNNALKIAKKDYVSFIDSDDYYIDKSGLRKMIEELEKKGKEICCSLLKNDRDGVVQDPYRYTYTSVCFDGNSSVLLDYHDWQYDYNYQAYVFNRRFLSDNCLFFPEYRRYQDPPFLVKCLCLARTYLIAPVNLYCYRVTNKHLKYNFVQVNDTLKGISDNIEYAIQNGLEILVSNSIDRLNSDFYTVFKESIQEGNWMAVLLLFEICKTVNFEGGRDESILLMDWIIDTLGNKPISKCCKESFLFPFKEIRYGSSIVLYGAGKCGKEIHSFIRNYSYCSIEKWIDKNYCSINCKGVEPPESIKSCSSDTVLIAVGKDEVYEDIKNGIIKLYGEDRFRCVGPLKQIKLND